MNIEELGLSLRTNMVLVQQGIETEEQLSKLHLLPLFASQHAGHLALREIRQAQLKLASRKDAVVLSEDAALDGLAPIATETTLAEVATILEKGQWAVERSGEWKLWLRDAKAVNRLFLAPGSRSLRLEFSQYDEETGDDVGCKWLVVPNDAIAFVNAVVAVGSNLQWVTNGAGIVSALSPHVVRSYLVTRPEPSETGVKANLLPLDPPGA